MGSHNEVQQLRSEMLAGFSDVSERFAQVDERFAQVDERFARIEKRLDESQEENRQRFERLEERLERRIEESQEETRRHFDIVTERTHSMIELFVEQFRSERSAREALGQRVEHLEEGELVTRNRLALLERKRR